MIKRLRLQQRSFLTRRSIGKERRKLILTIIFAAILGYLLVFRIIPFFIGSLAYLNKLKPTTQNQTALIEDATIAPPVLNIPFESTNNPELTVSGYSQIGTRVEIYLDDALQTTTTIDEDGNFQSDPIELTFGNNRIFGKTVREDGRRSLGSKPINIYYSNEKPKLEVSSPTDNLVVAENRQVVVSGSTNSDKIIITVNDIRLIVDSAGNFSRTFNLQDGDNNYIVKATDSAGNSSQISRKVTFQAPSPTPVESEPVPNPES